MICVYVPMYQLSVVVVFGRNIASRARASVTISLIFPRRDRYYNMVRARCVMWVRTRHDREERSVTRDEYKELYYLFLDIILHA